MGLNEINEQMYYPATLTREEKARMHPLKKTKCVMMPSNTSPTLQSPIPTSGTYELPEDSANNHVVQQQQPLNHHQSQQQNKIGSNRGSPSPRVSKSSGDASPEVEAIEEALPIGRASLPTPEPRPVLERNGLKSKSKLGQDHPDTAISKKPTAKRDVDEDSCVIKCVYFTQQCCECVIV